MAYDDSALPDDISSVLQKTLADRPQDRYSSAADFKKELDRLLYGGAYSPTTFNLALFMDRLFRSEMEAEDLALEEERSVDVTPYLEAATPEPAPIPIDEDDEAVGPLVRKPFVIAAAAAGILAVSGLWYTIGRGPATPPPQPTPTAAEIAAQRQAQEDKMRELAESLVREMMAEKEDEIRKELADRQAKIDELQQRLVASEGRAQKGQLTNEEEQNRQAIQRQLAAEEEAQRQREAELEAERLQAEEEARQQAAAQQTATAVAEEEEALLAAAATPTPPPPTPTMVPTPEPTEVVVEPNSFFEPSDVDSLPVIVKEQAVEWPGAAQKSRRQGVIILQATVNADGFVEAVKVLRADDEGFGIPQAAENAAMGYRFKPGTKAGINIKTYATITVPYRFVFTR
jgi:TonB family protein